MHTRHLEAAVKAAAKTAAKTNAHRIPATEHKGRVFNICKGYLPFEREINGRRALSEPKGMGPMDAV